MCASGYVNVNVVGEHVNTGQSLNKHLKKRTHCVHVILCSPKKIMRQQSHYKFEQGREYVFTAATEEEFKMWTNAVRR